MTERIILANEYEIEFRVRHFKNGSYGLVCTECEREKRTPSVWLLRNHALVLRKIKEHRAEHFGERLHSS
jgi:transcription antitermination factor NusA-like protein